MKDQRNKKMPIDHPERRKAMPVNGKNVTWQWLVGVLVVLLFAAGGVLLADNKAKVQKNETKIEQMQERKVDKEQYYIDISDIKKTLVAIDGKIDRIRQEIR